MNVSHSIYNFKVTDLSKHILNAQTRHYLPDDDVRLVTRKPINIYFDACYLNKIMLRLQSNNFYISSNCRVSHSNYRSIYFRQSGAYRFHKCISNASDAQNLISYLISNVL